MRQKPPKKLSLHKMIPNMITLAALASGMSSVKFAIAEKWELAVIAIIAAVFMDGFDGAAARLLKASSKLGAELDSLSDFISFGVAPAIVLYLWSLQEIGRWGWFICLVYAMALGLRLARFNVRKEEDETEDPDNPLHKYFTGVPAPIDALLCLLPMIVAFMLEDYDTHLAPFMRAPAVTGLWALCVAGMAVSHIPTFSTKQIRIPYKMRVPALGIFCVLIAGLINDPWPTLVLMAAVYLALMPFGMMHYARKEKALAAGHKDPDDADGDD